MSLFGKQTSEQSTPRDGYLAKYANARSNLLAVIVFTFINMVLLVCQADSYFLFSASIPYFLVGVGMMLCGKVPLDDIGSTDIPILPDAVLYIFLTIAVVFVLLYALCWLLSKDMKWGWMVTALVLFAVDTAGMLLLYGITADMLLDVVFHVWVLYSLITAVIAANKWRQLPPEEPLYDETGAVSAVAQMVPEAETSATDGTPVEDVTPETR